MKDDVMIYKKQAVKELRELQTVIAAEGDPILAAALNRPIGCIENQPEVDAVEVRKVLEWLRGYAFSDTKQVYTNGAVLVPMFRVEQALVDKAYIGMQEA